MSKEKCALVTLVTFFGILQISDIALSETPSSCRLNSLAGKWMLTHSVGGLPVRCSINISSSGVILGSKSCIEYDWINSSDKSDFLVELKGYTVRGTITLNPTVNSCEAKIVWEANIENVPSRAAGRGTINPGKDEINGIVIAEENPGKPSSDFDWGSFNLTRVP